MKVAICTPCYDGRLHLGFALSYADTRIEALKRRIGLEFIHSRGCANLPRARNLLVANALHDGVDAVFFIDSDIEWRVEDFFRLLDHPHDIVAGVPQKRTQRWLEEGSMGVLLKNQNVPADGEQVIEVQKAPTAFMRIKATVFKSLEDAGIAQKFRYDPMPDEVRPFVRNYFWYELAPLDDGSTDERQDDGEDYYFCRKFASLGGKIHIDLDVELVHYEGLVKHWLTMRQWFKAVEHEREQKGLIVPPGFYEAA